MLYKATIGTSNEINAQYLEEDNFSVVNEDVLVWEGQFPFEPGDTFPTKSIKDRANKYKTNLELYKNNYSSIYGQVINFYDALRKPLSNYPILQLLPNLPDYHEITETNVDLIAAKAPKIDGNVDIDKLNQLVSKSNFSLSYQSVIRECIMYGNSIKKVDYIRGKLKIVSMPVKCWIPFMSKEDTTEIEVDMFFNIYEQDSECYCEFILYHYDGLIERYAFNYDKTSGTLGQQVGEIEITKAFNGKFEISPIIVFTGFSAEDGAFGEDLYKYWDAAIASSIRAYGVLLQLLEKTKEFTKVMPASATQRDEVTGSTYDSMSDTILYDGDAPTVTYSSPNVESKIPVAIQIYEETLKRLSRDTSLAFSMFDTKELGTNMSAKALKVSMYKSELRAKSFITRIMGSLKELIQKMALLEGLELDTNDFSVLCESGFVQDIETITEVVQKRNGSAVTLSVEDSIAILDDISTYEAKQKAQELLGIDTSSASLLQDLTDNIETNSSLGFTVTNEDSDINEFGTGEEPTYTPLEGSDINANS